MSCEGCVGQVEDLAFGETFREHQSEDLKVTVEERLWLKKKKNLIEEVSLIQKFTTLYIAKEILKKIHMY